MALAGPLPILHPAVAVIQTAGGNGVLDGSYTFKEIRLMKVCLKHCNLGFILVGIVFKVPCWVSFSTSSAIGQYLSCKWINAKHSGDIIHTMALI